MCHGVHIKKRKEEQGNKKAAEGTEREFMIGEGQREHRKKKRERKEEGYVKKQA